MYRYACVVFVLIALACILSSCSSSNPNMGRVLTSIAVQPTAADAQHFTNGQVVFTATGTFSLPPFSAPLTFTAPYAGSFTVDNPSGNTIANIVSTSTGAITVQCVSGVSGIVFISATANANNNMGTVVSGSGELTCP